MLFPTCRPPAEPCWNGFEGSADRLRAEIDPTWQGDIPRTLLIGRDGEMTTIEGAAEMDDLKNWSERQLAATK